MSDDSPHASEGPADEAARRARALDRLEILATGPEPAFDDLARLAADLCGAPAAVIAFGDGVRSAVKAVHGLAAGDPRLAARAVGAVSAPSPASAAGPAAGRILAAVPIADPDGIVVGSFCVLDPVPRDLNPVRRAGLATLARQVQTQLALRRTWRDQRVADGLHRQILASAIDYAIIATDPGGRITSWNEGAERLFGPPEPAMLGQALSVIFTPEDRAERRPDREMARALADRVAPDERWHLRADGTRFWGSGQLMVLRSETEAAVGFLKIVRDRTEARQAAEDRDRSRREIAAAEARFRLLFERMSEGLAVLDGAGAPDGSPGDLRLVECNPAFARLTGLPPAGATGGSLGRWRPDLRDALLGPAARAVASGAPVEVEIRVPSLAGRWLAGTLTPGERGSLTLLASDATGRKLAEDRRKALVLLGERLREARDSAGMAHAAAELLGRTLAADRAGFGTVDRIRDAITVERDWTAPDVPSLVGTLRFREYGSYVEALKRGETVVVEDAGTDPRTAASALPATAARAFVNLPVIEGDAVVALFFVASQAPRAWREEEITFIRNVADRTRAAVARLRAEDGQRLLHRELGHRLKNTLAMVQAIAAQTMRNAVSLPQAQEALSARMVALGQAHDLLLGGERETARLGDLIARAVQILDDTGERLRLLPGPALEVGSRAALSLAIMLHELGTNALKYGALSRPEGRVEIGWTVAGTGEAAEIHLAWTENGGPPVLPPTRRGFGSRLITRGLAGQIGGVVTLDYPPEGVRCFVRCPLASFQADEIHPVRPADPEA